MKNKSALQIKYLQDVDKKQQNSLWYGGDVVEIKFHDNVKFIISARGDVIGYIYNIKKDISTRFKDKLNNGIFKDVIEDNTTIKTDEELQDAISSSIFYRDKKHEKTEYEIELDYGNWWETSMWIKDQDQELDLVLDSDNIEDAIKETIGLIPKLLKEFTK